MLYVLKEKKNVACVPVRFLFHSRSFSPNFPQKFLIFSPTDALKSSCCVADEVRLIYFYLWL